MRGGGQGRRVVVMAALALVAGGCGRSSLGVPDDGDPKSEVCHVLYGAHSPKLDLLLVIDNSDSMEHEQKSLKQSFPSDLERLRTAKLGQQLPDLRIGVISTDLGAGPYKVGKCRPGGDQARLQTLQTIAGCTPPVDPWIAYSPGKTNVPGSGSALSRAKNAFICISQLGTGGCGFEQPLEAMQTALDPTLQVNPGFLRPDAMLAVIFLSDEDDCSARDHRLYDPSSQGLTDPLGPLTSFRCFEFGVSCDCPGKAQCTRQDLGPRKNCVPRPNGLLYGTARYVKFLRQLKRSAGYPDPDLVFVAASAGPVQRVEVGLDGKLPTLKPSCQTAMGYAVPGIRLEAVVRALTRRLSAAEVAQIKAKKVNTPYVVDSGGGWREQNFSTICTSRWFTYALDRLADRITHTLGQRCLTRPQLTASRAVACHKGDNLGPDAKGNPVVCQDSCLEHTGLSGSVVKRQGRAPLRRCPTPLFDPALKQTQCGQHCPCWRVLPSAACKTIAGSSPYALEVMHSAPPAVGTSYQFCGTPSAQAWGSAKFAALPQCQ